MRKRVLQTLTRASTTDTKHDTHGNSEWCSGFGNGRSRDYQGQICDRLYLAASRHQRCSTCTSLLIINIDPHSQPQSTRQRMPSPILQIRFFLKNESVRVNGQTFDSRSSTLLILTMLITVTKWIALPKEIRAMRKQLPLKKRKRDRLSNERKPPPPSILVWKCLSRRSYSTYLMSALLTCQ